MCPRGSRVILLQEEAYVDIFVDENCTTCGEGLPVASGARAGERGERIRWAAWSCGHTWSSDESEKRPKDRVTYLRRALAAAGGLKRHAPLLQNR
jgi:hypothetical protein